MHFRKEEKSQALDLPAMVCSTFQEILKIAGKEEPADLLTQFKAEFDKFPEPTDDEICLKHIRNLIEILVDETHEFPEHLLFELWGYLRSKIITARFSRKYIPDMADIWEFKHFPSQSQAHSSKEWAKRTKQIHWESL
jgi:hypothetical protein